MYDFSLSFNLILLDPFNFLCSIKFSALFLNIKTSILKFNTFKDCIYIKHPIIKSYITYNSLMSKLPKHFLYFLLSRQNMGAALLLKAIILLHGQKPKSF